MLLEVWIWSGKRGEIQGIERKLIKEQMRLIEKGVYPIGKLISLLSTGAPISIHGTNNVLYVCSIRWDNC